MPSIHAGDRIDGDPTRLAVLGVGNIGSVHLRSALAMPETTVVAAADVATEHRRWAEDAGVSRTYEDATELLAAEELDVAVVAVPPFLHREVVEVAAEAGVDVFVEKPLARSVAEGESLLEAAREGDIAVGVDHTLRYQPDIEAVRESYAAGELGHVPYATMTRLNDGVLGRPPIRHPPSEWQLDPEAAGGGALLELGVHCFDVLEWIFGPLEVDHTVLDRTVDLPMEDAATVVLREPERGTTVVCHCGTYQWERLPAVNTRLCLEGVADTAQNTSHQPPRFYPNAAREALSNVWKRLTGRQPTVFGPTYYLQAHHRALEDFVRSIRAGEDPPVDGEDGLRTVALVEEAVDAAEREEALPVPEVTA